MSRLQTSDGEWLDLLPKDTKVRHKDYPELTGEIVGYEYHESGKVSPIPYKVYWDDDKKARPLLGFLRIYQGIDSIEEVK